MQYLFNRFDKFLFREIVAEETLLGQFLVLRPRSAVIAIGIDADAATGGEDAGNFDILRVHQSD